LLYFTVVRFSTEVSYAGVNEYMREV